jgi:hypothetical protein
MPDTRIGAQPIEYHGSRQRRVHHDEVRNLIAKFRGIGVGHHQPDIVSYQDQRALNLQDVPNQLADVLRHRLLVVSITGPGRISRPAIIRRDDSATGIDQAWNQTMPLEPGLGKTVQQYRRPIALARRHIVQTYAGSDIGHSVNELSP